MGWGAAADGTGFCQAAFRSKAESGDRNKRNCVASERFRDQRACRRIWASPCRAIVAVLLSVVKTNLSLAITSTDGDRNCEKSILQTNAGSGATHCDSPSISLVRRRSHVQNDGRAAATSVHRKR